MGTSREEERIETLNVHSLDGEFYDLTRSYLERHGVKWTETRGRHKELEGVFLTLPVGTSYIELPGDLKYLRHKVTLPDGFMFYWNIQKNVGYNQISVPVVYL